MRKKVVVAMSGGVDSSLTAAILQYRGFEVVGVTMRLDESGGCCDIADAQAIAEYLGIEYQVADYRKFFHDTVEKYFVEEYLSGRTPNPCVRCNREVKFGKLFEFADFIGADFLATGHYARVVTEGGRVQLKRAVDERKDQSYVLYNLTAEKLSRIIFPLGELTKSETRELAERLRLPVAHKPDSQEVCFVPNDDYKNFLQSAEPNAEALQSGEIVDASGKVLGSHSGVANYTIGQRRGLGIAAEHPLYVTGLNVARRQIIVGSSEKLFSKRLTAEDAHWIYKPQLPRTLHAKIRYGSRLAECTVAEDEKKLRLNFAEPQRAITPGQSVVFYDGEEVLGGAIISCDK